MRNVIIVEHEPEMADTLSRIINHVDPKCRILNLTNTEDAIELLEATGDLTESIFDLMIVNLQLPTMGSSVELLEYSKSNHPGLPLLGTTRGPATEILKQLGQKPPVLTKPFKVEDCIQMVSNYV